MTPVLLDLAGRDPHLLVLGDSRCGKTTVLRGLAQGAIDRHSPDELVIALMDARGELAGDIPDEYLGGHATSGRQARQLAESIAAELEKRAADRSAGGPRIVVIADDFDILAAGGAEPLRPLLPYLASARDLRLNVVVSRPVAGASRAMFDVALQGVRDTGGTALIMSGDRARGSAAPQALRRADDRRTRPPRAPRRASRARPGRPFRAGDGDGCRSPDREPAGCRARGAAGAPGRRPPTTTAALPTRRERRDAT